MESFNWREFIAAAEGRSAEPKPRRDAAPEHRRLTTSAKWALVMLGLALSCMGFLAGDSWVRRSPLFTVLGGAASMVFAIASLAAGMAFWLLTRNGDLCCWAVAQMPFGGPAYRSAAGILASMLIVARYWDRLPGMRKVGLNVLLWVSRLLWLAAVTACLVAIVLAVRERRAKSAFSVDRPTDRQVGTARCLCFEQRRPKQVGLGRGLGGRIEGRWLLIAAERADRTQPDSSPTRSEDDRKERRPVTTAQGLPAPRPRLDGRWALS